MKKKLFLKISLAATIMEFMMATNGWSERKFIEAEVIYAISMLINFKAKEHLAVDKCVGSFKPAIMAS